ncbi:hypothetical protein AbraIFM66950_009624 [Aspergillus brasiliensis]|nr:hypothetical protein AbraIFM66950_009624 [Aspergillus brasiliensis]
MSPFTRFFGFFQAKQAPQSRLSPAESKQAVDEAYASCVDLHARLGSLDDTQWIELSHRCSDLGFGFVDVPTEESCPNDCAKHRDNRGGCGNLSIDSSSKPSTVPSFCTSSWESQFERVARQVLDSAGLPHIQSRHGSDTPSSGHAQEHLPLPALTANGIHDSQLQVDIVMDSFWNCQDSSEIPENQTSYGPGNAAALSSIEELQNNLIDFHRISNLDGINAPPANTNYDSQPISPMISEVDAVDPSEVVTFPVSDSQRCSTDGRLAGLTGHDRDVDQVMTDGDGVFPWSPTPASVNHERTTLGTRDRLEVNTDAIGSSPGPAAMLMEEVDANSPRLTIWSNMSSYQESTSPVSAATPSKSAASARTNEGEPNRAIWVHSNLSQPFMASKISSHRC